MSGSVNIDLEDLMSKEFHTFRKTKNYSEIQFSTKYSFINLVNKHFVRNSDHLLDQVSITCFKLIV